jgi:SAM-dependent methyltransferase
MLATRGFTQLIGVDQSPHELAAARERLGGRAEFHCQDAGSLPFPAHSVDRVMCHMALMLLEPVDTVLGEIARVLKPGGLLVAVINRPHPDPAWDVFRRELLRITAEARLNRLRLGNPHIFTEEGTRTLFRGTSFDENGLVFRDFVIRTRVAPHQLWSMFELMYDVFRLSAPAREQLAQRSLAAWEPLLDDTGLISAGLGMRLIKCPVRGTERQP